MEKIQGMFCHVAKAAGTSQIEVIKKYNHLILYDMQTWIKYLDKNPTTNINNIFTWTFIRHPLDRIASIYGAWQHKGKKIPIQDIIDLAILGDALNWRIKECFTISNEIRKLEIWEKTEMSILEHLIPCHVYIDTWEKGMNKKLNFIGKFENLKNDWEYVCQTMSIVEPLPHKNTSVHREWSEYFDKETKDIIFDIYKQDFVRYGYKT